ncbi:hypothetical protein DICPUDRAFT_80222 [Dictyostelium purpureum]|uniref:Uncharacterized protein n=1 Tax=Dictyostelium purpureum TaxID=5786 RepID=F0ZPV8_DICPU|nr:uncharacterized protein DICPUDRAFT_80222 [Dictyostelium purpureum]EGC34008.1 hypothetical protein DICPUDRAFT_80222 [Dictyostelium purpureum]|eukprot:XP_003289452.1 hypothetical protein DICPUDRAFT_80222 [Dictyostelium purpureum]
MYYFFQQPSVHFTIEFAPPQRYNNFWYNGLGSQIQQNQFYQMPHHFNSFNSYRAQIGLGNQRDDEIKHKHHIFPRQFKEWFSQKGINIDDHCILVTRYDHFNLIHGRGGWNLKWGIFIMKMILNDIKSSVYCVCEDN